MKYALIALFAIAYSDSEETAPVEPPPAEQKADAKVIHLRCCTGMHMVVMETWTTLRRMLGSHRSGSGRSKSLFRFSERQ